MVMYTYIQYGYVYKRDYSLVSISNRKLNLDTIYQNLNILIYQYLYNTYTSYTSITTD